MVANHSKIIKYFIFSSLKCILKDQTKQILLLFQEISKSFQEN